MTDTFAAGEGKWRARLGTLRQVVRQDLVSRQLADHLAGRPGQRILDIGCGQGSQLLLLARRGHLMTGLDSSAALLSDLGELPARRAAGGARPGPPRPGRRPAGGGSFGPEGFDAVLCHGVLMYLPDPGPLLAAIAAVTAPGGLVSLLVRNGDALAMRPGLSGDWLAAASCLRR